MTDNDHGALFEKAYRAYYARVVRYLRACGLPDADAQDLAHDTFKRFYERINHLRSDNAWPFLMTIARSTFLNHVRYGRAAKRSGTVVNIDAPELAELSDGGMSADALSILHDCEALQALPLRAADRSSDVVRVLPIRVFAEANESEIIEAVKQLVAAGGFKQW